MHPTLPWTWLLADSELGPWHADAAGGLSLSVAAACLRHPIDQALGHAPRLRLDFQAARLHGTPVPGRVRDGRLRVDGQWSPGCPVPGRWQAAPGTPLVLEWTGAWGDAVRIEAQAMDARFDGDTIDWQPWLHC